MKQIRVGLLSVARRVRKNVQVNMQRTRLKLLVDLEAMFNMAKGYATNENTKNKQRQIWIHIMAYIGQVFTRLYGREAGKYARFYIESFPSKRKISTLEIAEGKGKIRFICKGRGPGSPNRGKSGRGRLFHKH